MINIIYLCLSLSILVVSHFFRFYLFIILSFSLFICFVSLSHFLSPYLYISFSCCLYLFLYFVHCSPVYSIFFIVFSTFSSLFKVFIFIFFFLSTSSSFFFCFFFAPRPECLVIKLLCRL